MANSSAGRGPAQRHVGPAAAGRGPVGAPPDGSIPAVAAIGVTRRFPGILANDDVSFELMPGEIHALLGENGSGKTTLCKILTGLYRADAGRIEVDGRPVHFHSPRDSFQAGIFMVQQHFSLVERLTVAENVVLGWSQQQRLWFDAAAIRAEVADYAQRFHLPVDPAAAIWQLSVGERQRVEILKALYRGARILILDEPTTVLTPTECDELFTSLRALAAEGRSVVFVTHRLPEVLAVCDRVSVLRQGRNGGTFPVSAAGLDVRQLAQLMVGRDVATLQRVHRQPRRDAPVVLRAADVSAANQFGRLRVRQASLDVRAGEIVGIAGVAGNGQREFAEALTGLRPRVAGTVHVSGRPLPSGRPRAAIKARVAYVPEDRMGTGLVPSLPIRDNLILKAFRDRRFRLGPMLRNRTAAGHADELLERFRIKGTGRTPVRELSGGHAQRVVLARELSSDPVALIAAAPTRGLDVAAADSVRRLLVEAADRGVAVLLISEDLDELLAVADRLAVIYEGRFVGVVDAERASREQLGLMMAGGGAAA